MLKLFTGLSFLKGNDFCKYKMALSLQLFKSTYGIFLIIILTAEVQVGQEGRVREGPHQKRKTVLCVG